MPSVDVLVPCYNYGRYLRDCVGSVLAQPGCEVRVLVIDDCSPDGSGVIAQQLAAEDPRVEAVVHGTNRGHIATYNEGIAWSRGEYFLLLSADDMLLPGALARAVGLMARRPEVSWTYGREIELRPGDDLAAAIARGVAQAEADLAWRVTPGAEFVARLCRSGLNHVPTCTAVVRGAAQRRIGGYRTGLPHAGDLEMWLRLSTCGAVGECAGLLGIRRLHATNMYAGYAGLPDLRQRAAAFESFFAHEGRLQPEVGAWRSAARRSLAQEATRWGLANLRRGRLRTGLECLGLGLRLSPASAAAAPLHYLDRLRPAGARISRS